ncbi:efflux RND transporter permease subunit [Methylocystis sp. IM3]|uniref:efflux RND transporter permease subunit n=1 Tax=Methylocystis sp. IM3 TaxID=3136722 RepID=UPI0031193C37
MSGVVVLALRRPYTFVVLSICILIFGLMAVFKTPTDVFPNIKIPVVAVVWAYAGLLPTEVSGRITYLYERQLTSNVEGIEHIESHSYYGSSIIKIFLQPGVDLAAAEADIDSISQTVTKQLPPDISPPMVMRLEASSVPVAMLKVTAESLTPADLYNLAKNKIRPFLVTIPGAILPHPYGGQDKQLLVSLDQQKLLARHLTAADVHNALGRQSIVLPAGDMKLKATDWMVQTNATPMQVADFNNIPIKTVGNATIYMRDVADVRLGGPPQINAVLVDGKQSVLIVVMKSGEASTLEVVDGIKKAIPRIEQIAPPGVKVELLNDASLFVEDSIIDVLREMALASALTGVVVLLFLGSWRATVIIATSIPLSILSAIICLHWIGQTINVMTLGGLALAVGILVDDATVMIENIDTHIEMGKPLETAIIDAANQIVIPTFVSTLCIIIVWFPLFELTGVSGWLFTPMAEAVMFAMMASFILSRTLVPTMAKYLLVDPNGPNGHGHAIATEEAPSLSGRRKFPTEDEIYALANADAETNALAGDGGISHFAVPIPDPHDHIGDHPSFFKRIQRGFEHGFERFRERYSALLSRTLDNRRRFVAVFLAAAVASLSLFYFNGQEFFPEIKSGILQMHMRAPLGTRIEASGRIATLVSNDIERLLPGQVEGIVSNCGLPVGPHNLAFIPTPTIGAQDCDMTITPQERRLARVGLSSHFAQSSQRALPRNGIHLSAS